MTSERQKPLDHWVAIDSKVLLSLTVFEVNINPMTKSDIKLTKICHENKMHFLKAVELLIPFSFCLN